MEAEAIIGVQQAVPSVWRTTGVDNARGGALQSLDGHTGARRREGRRRVSRFGNADALRCRLQGKRFANRDGATVRRCEDAKRMREGRRRRVGGRSECCFPTSYCILHSHRASASACLGESCGRDRGAVAFGNVRSEPRANCRDFSSSFASRCRRIVGWSRRAGGRHAEHDGYDARGETIFARCKILR